MYHISHGRTPLMKELPPEERPREKVLSSGIGALSNTELLAMLLGTGTREESAVNLAARVIATAESLPLLSGLGVDELCRIKGIGMAKACSLAAAFELGRRCAVCAAEKRPSICTPDDFAGLFMEEMRYLKKEHFRVVLLNVKKEVIGSETVSMGGISSTAAAPREVFAAAVRKGAHAMIAAHNHPSGDPSPSDADLDLTVRLAEAGQVLGIELLDHIIIGDGTFISMKQQGIL